MTAQHPLTDEICREIGGDLELDWMYRKDYMCMRAGADWQLEQVFKWIRDNIQSQEADYEWYYAFDSQIEDLKKAMRPTTQEKTDEIQLY